MSYKAKTVFLRHINFDPFSFFFFFALYLVMQTIRIVQMVYAKTVT